MALRSRAFSPTSGFTMLEVVMVLALLGITMAIAAPGFARSRDSAAVRSASGDLAATFSFARQTALNRRALTAVVLDTASGVVTVRTAGERVLWRALRGTYGIVLGANRDSAVYDLRGLGYGVSNLTMTVRRGSIVDTLTMSRLGRLR